MIGRSVAAWSYWSGAIVYRDVLNRFCRRDVNRPLWNGHYENVKASPRRRYNTGRIHGNIDVLSLAVRSISHFYRATHMQCICITRYMAQRLSVPFWGHPVDPWVNVRWLDISAATGYLWLAASVVRNRDTEVIKYCQEQFSLEL